MPVAMSSARQPISAPSASVKHAGRAFDPHALDLLRRENFHAKTPRLGNRAPGQIRAAEPHWKAEIVLDARTPSRLPAGRLPFNQQRVQAIRRRHKPPPQARRTRADDHQIVERKFRLGFQSQLAGHFGDGRVAQKRTVGKDHQRQ